MRLAELRTCGRTTGPPIRVCGVARSLGASDRFKKNETRTPVVGKRDSTLRTAAVSRGPPIIVTDTAGASIIQTYRTRIALYKPSSGRSSEYRPAGGRDKSDGC